jgi:hypothetical protein
LNPHQKKVARRTNTAIGIPSGAKNTCTQKIFTTIGKISMVASGIKRPIRKANPHANSIDFT